MSETCSVDGCSNNAHSRGYCQTHYSRWRIHRDPQAHVPVRKQGETCGIPDCGGTGKWGGRGPLKGRCICKRHRLIYKRFGVFQIPDGEVLTPLCSVHTCRSRARSRTSPYCEKHYHRMARTGQIDLVERQRLGVYQAEGGYIELLQPDHPLATKEGRVLAHRAAAYATHGGVCPACFWCDEELDWDVAVVDHLDEYRNHNDPDNLVVCCSLCNMQRSSMLRFLRKLHPRNAAVAIKQMFDESPSLNDLIPQPIVILEYDDLFEAPESDKF